MTKQVILTGIRSNEEPTLANFLGAIMPMVDMQRKFAGEYQINMFVPDLHSFTTPIDHENLYRNSLNNLKYFIAAGLDINNSDTYIYRQSYIPAHSELTWILDCFTYFGEMSRMTQFKEKSGIRDSSDTSTLRMLLLTDKVKKDPSPSKQDILSVIDYLEEKNKKIINNAIMQNSVSVGLFNYPVLMAADILLYGAKYVPVGEDQFQHLEITRDIATRFNNKFGEIFVVPEPTKIQTEFINRDNGLRIRSLTDPTKKMSKSATDEKSKILLIDSPDVAAKKIMGATTDSLACVKYDMKNQPGITSLLQMLAALTGRTQEEVNAEWEGESSYGKFKTAVADAVRTFLTDFQTRLNDTTDEILLAKLEQSERELTIVANATLLKAQQAVGLRPRSN